MGPSRAHGPSARPVEANGLPEAHGPPKVHGLRVHCTPCPPLGCPGLVFGVLTGIALSATLVWGLAQIIIRPLLDLAQNRERRSVFLVYFTQKFGTLGVPPY